MNIYTIQSCSAVKKNEMRFTGKWTKLGNMLHGVTQIQKDKHFMPSPIICGPYSKYFDSSIKLGITTELGKAERDNGNSGKEL